MAQKRTPSRGRTKKSGSGNVWFWIAVVIAAIMLFRTSGSKKVTPPRGAPPVAKPAPAPQGLAPFDWPRAAPDGAAPVLAEDLTLRNYYVILDGSGSMQDTKCSGDTNKMRAAKRALTEFSQVVPRDAQLGLLVFDRNGNNERVPLGTGNRDRFIAAVKQVNASGGTPLKTAIDIGVAKLEEQARRQLGYGEYHLVVVTDGEASLNEDPARVVAELLGRSPVVLHTIGFCIGEQHSLNQPGQTLYKAAANPGELKAGLSAVLAESESFDVSGFKN
ncbi:MAG: vWA domain-containing protein [Elusimicrobiota bacterium]